MIRLYVSFGTHCSTRRSCTTCLATFENARSGAGGYSVGKRKKFATVTPKKWGPRKMRGKAVNPTVNQRLRAVHWNGSRRGRGILRGRGRNLRR